MNIIDEHLVPRLKSAIGCPIEWEKYRKEEVELCKDLRLLWVKTAERHQAFNEMDFYSRWHLDHNLNESELERIEINAAIWRQSAVAEYLDLVGFLRSVRFATIDDYPKHFQIAGLTRSQIIEKTIKSDSLFFSTNIIPDLNFLMWQAIHQDLLNIVHNRPAHVFIKTVDIMGASEGVPIDLIRFDFDYGRPVVHGHPRLKVPANTKLLDENVWLVKTYSQDEYDGYDNDIDEPRLDGRLVW